MSIGYLELLVKTHPLAGDSHLHQAFTDRLLFLSVVTMTTPSTFIPTD